MSFDDYIRQHTAVRQKMIAARYPAITDEETTIDFILFGLQKTANLTPIIGNLIINKPNSIKDFVRKYKVLYDVYQLPHGLTPTPPPVQSGQYIVNSPTNPPTQQPVTHQYANSYQYRRPYRGQYRRPYHAPRRQLPPNQTPCSFHTSLGIPSQHTDSECRDPLHQNTIKTSRHRHATHRLNYLSMPTPTSTQNRQTHRTYKPTHRLICTTETQTSTTNKMVRSY